MEYNFLAIRNKAKASFAKSWVTHKPEIYQPKGTLCKPVIAMFYSFFNQHEETYG